MIFPLALRNNNHQHSKTTNNDHKKLVADLVNVSTKLVDKTNGQCNCNDMSISGNVGQNWINQQLMKQLLLYQRISNVVYTSRVIPNFETETV